MFLFLLPALPAGGFFDCHTCLPTGGWNITILISKHEIILILDVSFY
jgi:hypothetical protein